MFYSKFLKSLLLLTATITPLGITATCAAASSAAWTTVNQLSDEGAPQPFQISQTELEEFFEELEADNQPSTFPTVDEPRPTFSDLEGDAWEIESVYSLLQRYNCLAGFPDGTF